MQGNRKKGRTMIFETERLYLRKLNQGDFANLCTI